MKPCSVLLAACFVVSVATSCATTQATEPADLSSKIQAAKQDLKAARARGNNETEIKDLLLLQEYLNLSGELSLAIQYGQELQRTLYRTRKSPLPQEVELRSLNLLAADYLLTGDIAQSMSFAEKARDLSRRIQNPDNEKMAIYTLASVSVDRMDYEAATRWWKEALNLALRTGNQQAEAKILTELGDIYIGQNDYVNAISLCRQSLNAGGEPRAAALLCLGRSYDALQEPETSWKYLESAMHRAERERNPAAMALVALSVAGHDLSLGKSAQAAQWVRRSADFTEVANSKRTLTGRAPGLINQTSALFRPGAAESLRGVAEIMERQGRQAIPHLEKALALLSASRKTPAEMRPLFESKLLALLGYSYILAGRPEKGLQFFRRQWELSKSSPKANVRAIGLHNLGFALWRTGHLAEAQERLRATISEWDSTRIEPSAGNSLGIGDLFGSGTEACDFFVQVLIEQGRQEEALEIAERERSDLFISGFARQPISEFRRGLPPKVEALKAFAKERNLVLVEYFILYDPTGPLLPSRIGGNRPELEQNLLIWLIKPSGEIVFQKVDLRSLHEHPGNSLAETIRVVRSLIGGRGRGVQPLAISDPAEPLRRLYDLLIAPIAKHLPKDPEAEPKANRLKEIHS